jgi:general secretion pathway protein C
MPPLAQISLDPVTLQRLFRREAIGLVVTALKVALTFLALICIATIVRELIAGTLETRETVGMLQAKVAEIAALGSPEGNRRDKSAPYNKIAERNIFGPMTAPSTTAAPPPPPKPASVTPLGLVGTFVAEGHDPYAIIEDQKKKIQEVFDLNTMVFGEAKLTGIFADRVELERNGQKEILVLDDMLVSSKGESREAISAVDENEFIVDEAELDRALENLPLLLTQARAVPYFADGQAVGLRLFAIKSGSLYEKIGLRNGDVLKSVNGNSMADLSQAMQLFEKLKTERSINLTIERNREEKEFKYQIR